MITIRQFEAAVRATVEKNLRRSIMVLGPTGVGKSEVMHQIAQSYGMKVIDIRLLLWSLTDLKGIPYPDDTQTYTKWLINDVLPRIDRDGEAGILLLEELNASTKTVQAAAYQLTLDRRIGDYVLPDRWHIVATGNREQDNGVYTAPPAPLADRFEILEVEVDFNAWRDYAINVGYSPVIISYLSANRTALYTFKPEDSAELVFATPRSWAAVSDLLNAGFTEDILRIKMEGNIGAGEAAGLLKYMKNSELLPDIEAILSGLYMEQNAIPFRATLDVYYLLIQNLVHAVGSEFRRLGDKWKFYTDNAVAFICNIEDFPLELKKSYIDQLCKMDEGLCNGEFITKYIYNDSCSQQVSKLIQELDYIR